MAESKDSVHDDQPVWCLRVSSDIKEAMARIDGKLSILIGMVLAIFVGVVSLAGLMVRSYLAGAPVAILP